MSDTPNLALPYIIAAQAQKHVTHNEAIRALDAIVHLAVLDRNLTAPPGSPTNGDRYIVAASATGAWAGHDGEVAAYQDGAWMFYTPREGWLAWIADENVAVAYDGSAWVSLGGGGGGATTLIALTDTPANFTGSANKLAKVNAGETALEFSDQLPLLGVNATPDATNKLSLSAAATLFNNAGAGHQVKVNKNAAGDTASFLFQTGFSGRAEFGTAGDDDFHFKVSPDGATFYESFILDKDNGDAAFKQDVSFEGFVDVSEIAVPANPAANVARIYAKDDGGTTKLAMRDSAGTETVFGASGGGGGGTGDASMTDVLRNAIAIADLKGSALGLDDGIADAFDTEDNVDTSTSSNERFDAAGEYYAPSLSIGATDETTGKTAAASSSFSGYSPADAIDDDVNDEWLSSSSGSPWWWRVDFGSGTEKAIARVSITNRNHANGPDQSLKDFTIEGSDDASSWTVLATIVGESAWTQGESRDFDFYNVTDYRYYRLNVSANFSGSYLSLGEVEMFEGTGVNNMTLVSDALTADAVPASAHVQAYIKPIDAITINTDVIMEVSRDGGTTWTAATLVEKQTFSDGTKMFEDDSVSISGQPSGTSMKWRVRTLNAKSVEVTGVVFKWS